MRTKHILVFVSIFLVLSFFAQHKTFTVSDSLNKKHYLKIYPLLSLLNRYSAALEIKTKKNILLDFQVKVFFKSDRLKQRFQFVPNVAFMNDGAEMLVGLNFINTRLSEPSGSVTNGVYLSYRYQHISNENFYPAIFSGDGTYAYYDFSQTKNMLGIHYKISFAKLQKRFSFDSYLMAGFYTGWARTLVFYADYRQGEKKYVGSTINPEGMFKPNGLFVQPHLTIGVCPRFKLN